MVEKKTYLQFTDISIPKNKTKIFEVYHKDTFQYLGQIIFDTGWRTYVFEPESYTKFSYDCNVEINIKIKELNDLRKLNNNKKNLDEFT